MENILLAIAIIIGLSMVIVSYCMFKSVDQLINS